MLKSAMIGLELMHGQSNLNFLPTNLTFRDFYVSRDHFSNCRTLVWLSVPVYIESPKIGQH